MVRHICIGCMLMLVLTLTLMLMLMLMLIRLMIMFMIRLTVFYETKLNEQSWVRGSWMMGSCYMY